MQGSLGIKREVVNYTKLNDAGWSPFVKKSNVNDAMSNIQVGGLKEITLGSKDSKTIKMIINPHYAGLRSMLISYSRKVKEAKQLSI